jgi:LacI family transcriptional regulator
VIRLLLLTDFTESYSYQLFAGIQSYAQEHGRWAVCRMPPSYKSQHGLDGVLKWAKAWSADALIGRFEALDRVELFPEAGIITFSQDYKVPISSLPSITGGYREAGEMAARYFVSKGFSSFAFVGYRDVFWSQQRFYGFRAALDELGLYSRLRDFREISIDEVWDFRQNDLISFLRSLPPETALFACDDNEGIRIAELCRAYGIAVPQQIAILGVDDDKTLCNLSDPPLSSIALDVVRGGYAVAAQIDNYLSHKTSRLCDVTISPITVEERASTNILSISDREVAMAIEYIQAHADEPLSVGDVVMQVPLSRRQLEIRFKRSTHQTIQKYIMKQRVDRFAALLLQDDTPIAELCAETGFQSPKNLSRQFRSVMGISPQEYRRSHRGGTSKDQH